MFLFLFLLFPLSRFGQFLVSTLPVHPWNENDIKLDASASETNSDGVEGEGFNDQASPKKISLRNVMLELVLCLIYGEGDEIDHRCGSVYCHCLSTSTVCLSVSVYIYLRRGSKPVVLLNRHPEDGGIES